MVLVIIKTMLQIYISFYIYHVLSSTSADGISLNRYGLSDN